ncbi:MAG: hypothetical protein JXA99_15790 [Candidatus Lokiarchaeota archaeon]|nr:hypothetical protein [Candidatus Lokiarchaeota archaeon]
MNFKINEKLIERRSAIKISLLVSIILISSISGVLITSLTSTQSEENISELDDFSSALKTSQSVSESEHSFAFKHYVLTSFMYSLYVLWFNLDLNLANAIISTGISAVNMALSGLSLLNFAIGVASGHSAFSTIVVPLISLIASSVSLTTVAIAAAVTVVIIVAIVLTILLWIYHINCRGNRDAKFGIGVQILPFPCVYMYLDHSYKNNIDNYDYISVNLDPIFYTNAFHALMIANILYPQNKWITVVQ